ncbi:MAG: hypothetical protein WCI71_04610 [Bacteroidota bacterium]
MKKTVIFQVFSLVLFIGCTVTPEPNPEPNPVERSFNWSGFTWRVKNSTNETVGPGKNYFSNSTDNVWIDNGELHLKITKRNGKYYCPEVSTKESVSYGYYNFYISSRVDDLDKNVVVGLFTWNNMNCKTNANSEIDIEFSKWGNSNNSNTLIYSVQPTEGGQYFERTQSFPIQLNGDYSVHSFTWSSNLIEWSSYHGHTIPSPSSNYIASWTYDITNTQNQSRSKSECNSNPIKYLHRNQTQKLI